MNMVVGDTVFNAMPASETIEVRILVRIDKTLSSLVWLGKFAVLGPSKRTSPALLLLTTASVSA